MDEDQRDDAVAAYIAKITSMGGKARAKVLTPERRKEIATKASKAAAKARRQKARKKRKEEH
jgi:hypothetical protein